MTSERWEILDGDGQPTGRTMRRGENCLKSGEYHLVVHIWVLSENGNFLLQKRAADKKLMPGEWAATGGAAIVGETPYEAAHRELKEELGIDSTPETLVKITRLKRRNSLVDVWAITVDRPAESFVLQKSEVDCVRWVTPQEFREMIHQGKYHNYGKDYFDAVFAGIEDYRSATV
ncbi:MAG: NUDIX domain-containing protein [Clostridia bacterium]|nr:NUDIX domain-containing protein [Clostridia bacterium]